MVVAATVNKEAAVLKQFVGLVKIFTEESSARFRDRAFFNLVPDAIDDFADLADNIFAVGLNFGDLRAHYVSLFAMFKKLAASADPVLELHDETRKLAGQFAGEILQQREPVQDVGLDGLLEFGAHERHL